MYDGGDFLFVKIGSELHLMVGKFENGAPNTWIVAQSCAYLVGQSQKIFKKFKFLQLFA